MPRVGSTADRLYGPLARGFGERIRAAVQRFTSKAEAAKAMGLSTDQVNTLINEAAVPNFAAMASLAIRSGVTLDYLAFDRTAEAKASTGKSNSGPEDTVWLRRLDGKGAIPLPRAFIATSYDQRVEESLAAMQAPGNAMEPVIKRHALLVVDLGATRIVDGEIYVFDFAGDRVVRRTQREPDGALVLRADNSSYESLRLIGKEAATAKVLGRVVWVGSAI